MARSILKGVVYTVGAAVNAASYVTMKTVAKPYDLIMGKNSPSHEAKELFEFFAKEAAVEFGLIDE